MPIVDPHDESQNPTRRSGGRTRGRHSLVGRAIPIDFRLSGLIHGKRTHFGTATEARDVEPNLVRRAQQGDRGAFDLVVSEVVDRLYSVAYRILRHGPSAEDATQQALVDIWRHLPSLRDPDRFDAWAYRLLVHAAYAEHRRRRRQAPPGALTDGATDTDPYPSVHDRDQLERGFARLTAEQRAVLVLQHYLGLTHDEM